MSTFYPLHRYKNVRDAYDASLAVPPVDAFIRLNNRERLNPLTLLKQPTLTVTPLTLIGRLTPGWGEAFNENFLHLLENFADTRPPPSPISGQFWYQDTPGSPSMRFYSGELGTIWHDLVHSVQGRVQMGTLSLMSANGDSPQVRFGATTPDDRLALEQNGTGSDSFVFYLNAQEAMRVRTTLDDGANGVVVPATSDFYRGTMALGARIDAIGSLVSSINTGGNSTFNGNIVVSPPASIFSDRYFFASDPTTGMMFDGSTSGQIVLQSLGQIRHAFLPDGGAWHRGSGAGAVYSRATPGSDGLRGVIGFGSTEANGSGDMGLSYMWSGGDPNTRALWLWGTGRTHIKTSLGLSVDDGPLVSNHGSVVLNPLNTAFSTGITLNGNSTGTHSNGILLRHGNTNAGNRWYFGIDAPTAGGNFFINRHGGAGGDYLNTPFHITHTTGNVSFGNSVVVSGSLAVGGHAAVTGSITASGNLTLNNSGPTVALLDTGSMSGFIHVNDDKMYFLRGDIDETTWEQINNQWPLYLNLSNNNAVFGANVTATSDITAFSDAKFKEDVETISNGLELACLLRGVHYTDNRDGKQRIGFIAQEVQEILPNLVLADEDGTLSVAYHRVTAVLVEACKTLKKRAETAEAKLAAMEARLEAIEARLGSL